MEHSPQPVVDTRVDPYDGTVVRIVRSRQQRPNLPTHGCPFCVGGLEAPDPYEVRAFPNRWPSLGRDRCEVVLYTPQHDATFASLGVAGARRVVDLWADRTAHLRSLPGVEFVLVFENRGAEVGATIPHPHGQVYAYDHVPRRPARRLGAGWRPEAHPGERLVVARDGWQAWAQHAPVHPVSLCLAPDERFAALPEASDLQRDGLASMLVDVLGRLDRLYDSPLPYMLWMYQEPNHWDGPAVWFHCEIVSPWRSKGVARFIAAAEQACDEFINPVASEDLAASLRDLG